MTSDRILDAVGRVPRIRFVPRRFRHLAAANRPLPIGFGQTISQPHLVVEMTRLARPAAGDRALDVGTGSGYQAAILAELVDRVWGIEIVPALAASARARLARLGYCNVEIRQGDAYDGWRDEAPFDVIMVAAAPEHVPPALVEQLAPGGRLVIPVGPHDAQQLLLIEKADDGTVTTHSIYPVAFVPMTGAALEQPNV